MAATARDCGFVLVRAHLGARQEFQVLADPNVNVLDTAARFGCETSDGTSAATVVAVLLKLAAAIGSGAMRVSLDVNSGHIEG